MKSVMQILRLRECVCQLVECLLSVREGPQLHTSIA